LNDPRIVEISQKEMIHIKNNDGTKLLKMLPIILQTGLAMGVLTFAILVEIIQHMEHN
jgi:hypothetical protein